MAILFVGIDLAKNVFVQRVNQDERSASIKVRGLALAGGWRA